MILQGQLLVVFPLKKLLMRNEHLLVISLELRGMLEWLSYEHVGVVCMDDSGFEGGKQLVAGIRQEA